MADHSQARRPHVFVIDASPDFLTLARDLLEEEGYAVTTTRDRGDAFDQAAAWHPDGILLDLVPGEPEGWELLVRLHADATTATIPVLVLSTSEALLAQAQAQADHLGGNAYFRKPFDLEELLQTLQDLIGTP